MTDATPVRPSERHVSDWPLAALLASLIMLSTLAPYAVHHAREMPGRTYVGIERNLRDQFSYLMWINQVRRGANRVQNLYVHDLEEHILPQPLWGILGLIGRAVPLNTVVLYHGARVAIGLAYLLVLFHLARRFHPDRLTQWVAWLLAAVGGGLGWFARPVADGTPLRLPRGADTAMPELWSYTSLLYFPHFAASLLLLAACVVWLARAWENGRAWPSATAGLALGLLVLVHTYTAVAICAVLLLHVAWCRVIGGRRGPALKANVVALLVCLPFFAFQAWQVMNCETLQRWAEQNVMPSPPLRSYVVGFGLVGLAAAVGFVRALRLRLDPAFDSESTAGVVRAAFLVAWVIAVFVLLYAPVAFQRRCVEGLHIALALLAAPVVVALARRLAGPARPRRMAAWAGVFVLACVPGSLWHLAREIRNTVGYLDTGIILAEERVYQRHGEGGRVLPAPELGWWIPAQGRTRTFIGHNELSFDYEHREEIKERFFSPRLRPGERLELFRDVDCDVVLADRAHGDLLRREHDVWAELFRHGDVALFAPRNQRPHERETP